VTGSDIGERRGLAIPFLERILSFQSVMKRIGDGGLIFYLVQSPFSKITTHERITAYLMNFVYILAYTVGILLSRRFRSDLRNSPRTSTTYPERYQHLGMTEPHFPAFDTHCKPEYRSLLLQNCDNAAIFGLNEVTP
jgi:hypothetical protein